jgi:uncharacterized protein (TIGR03437 family)
MCIAICALAQTAPMALHQTRYEVRAGEPAQIAAPAETLDFLLHAKTRRASIEGMVVGPSYTGDRILLAASPLAKPGEYTVTLTAISETGEERQTTLAVVVKPQVAVPSNSARPPVVLVNGWMNGFTGGCPISTISTTFGNLAPYLVQDGVPVVYLFDNCAVDQGNTIEALGADLGAFLNTIKYDTGAQVPQIDLVAHSMGGLIARAYLAGIQPNQTFLPPSPTLVRKLVLIATPNFGSFVAGNYISSILTTSPTSQAAELVPGSALLWNLATWNQYYDDLRGVDALAVIGNAGSYIPNLSSSVQNNLASDGLVTLTSASLGFAVPRQSFPTRVVPYCHIDPTAFTNTAGLGAFACNNAVGIANVTDTNHLTGIIVRSFLAGTTAWSTAGAAATSNAWLKSDGGMFFALVNSAGKYVNDMSAVQWGTVPLNNGGDANTIFYVDMVAGTGAVTATSQSLGSVSTNPLTLALGYTSTVRVKIGTTISSVTPLASTSPQVLAAGATVTLNGGNFGSSQCSGCQVLATPAGATTAQSLTVTSWKNTAISVKLPATLTGLLTLQVVASGVAADTIGVMVAAPSTIAATPASLEFAYTAGGTVPAAQPIQISNSGTGTAALSWTATPSDSWLSVSPVSGTAPSAPSVTVSPAALSAGTYNGTIQITAAGASNSPVSVAVTLTVAPAQPAVTVTAVVNAGSYQPGIASGAWISIFGTNLSPSTYLWQASDIVNGALPTTLQGVSVTVNGLPAYVDYVSPTQINALVPDDATVGPVPIQVTTAGQASDAVTAQKSLFAPAFLTFDGTHVAALHADYSLIGAPNLLPGAVTTPAQPGEIILMYGVGFGPANPPQPSGQLVTTATPLANAVQVTIGGQVANVAFSGLTGSGLYQFNVTVPNLPNGDAAVAATIGGVSTQTGVSLTVQQ